MKNVGRDLRLFEEEKAQSRSQIVRDILARVKHWTQDDPSTAKRRWVWELFQNAIDVATQGSTGFDIRISLNKKTSSLIFAHNAGPFQRKHLVALILGGSAGKPWGRDSRMLGRFGRGFIVSHVLSRIVQVRGRLLDDGKQLPFSIEIDRRGTEDEIRANIDRCYEQVNQVPDRPCKYEAEFSYRLEDTLAHQAAEEGLEDLARLLPFLFSFTDRLRSVNVDGLSYGKAPATQFARLPQCMDLVETRVTRHGTTRPIGAALKVSGNGVHIVFPAASRDGDTVTLMPISQDIPRIFVAVPFIGTESLGLPFVLNSEDFAPNESRDSIPLAVESGDRTESDSNRRLVDAAMRLYVDAIKSLATGGASGVVEAVRFVEPKHPKQAVRDYFHAKVSETVLALFSQVKCVGTNSRGLLAPEECCFPVPLVRLVDNPERTGIDDFKRELLEDFYDLVDKLILDKPLPLKEEAYQWQAVIRAWKSVNPTLSPDWFCLDRLKSKVTECGKQDSDGTDLVPRLEDLTRKVIVVEPRMFLLALFTFLDELYDLPSRPIEADYANGLLLDQAENLGSATFSIGEKRLNLWSDEDVPDRIKDLSEILCTNEIRLVLLDSDFKRFRIVSSLALPKMEIDSAVEYILLDKPQDGYKFKESEDDKTGAWVDLCVFLTLLGNRGCLKSLPLLVKSGEVKYFADNRLLPPFPAINLDADYEGIFPEDRILSSRYSDSAGEKQVVFWEALGKAGIVHSNLVFAIDSLKVSESNVDKLREICRTQLRDEQHTISGPFWAIPFWQEVRGRIGQQQGRSRSFLNLLLDVVCSASTSWNETQVRTCTCGEDHSVYPAEWLMQVKAYAWVAVVRDPEKHVVEAMAANEANIINMVGEDQIRSILVKPSSVDLLSHFGFSRLTLSVEAYVEKTPGATREDVTKTLSTLLKSEDSYGLARKLGSLSPEDMSKVKKVVVGLDERRERAADNKAKGDRIELCVRSLLADVYRLPLNPARITAGADIEVWPENGGDAGLDACQVETGSTLVEVKLITGGSRVRMSSRQGQETQTHKGRYYLCVVDFRDNDASQLLVMADSALQEIVRQRASFSDMLGRFDAYFASGGSSRDIEADIEGFWVRDTLWGQGADLETWVETIR